MWTEGGGGGSICGRARSLVNSTTDTVSGVGWAVGLLVGDELGAPVGAFVGDCEVGAYVGHSQHASQEFGQLIVGNADG